MACLTIHDMFQQIFPSPSVNLSLYSSQVVESPISHRISIPWCVEYFHKFSVRMKNLTEKIYYTPLKVYVMKTYLNHFNSNSLT